MKHLSAALIITLALTGCSRLDYHGMDPKTYNEVIYPKKNQVEYTSVYHSFYFPERENAFDKSTILEMDTFLARTYPDAVQHLQLVFGSSDPARELYVTRLLRARGFKKASMAFSVDENMHTDEVIIEMEYSFVKGPRCPDWRKDPIINYSGTNHSDFGCTTAVNLGAQMANPADIEASSTHRVVPDGAVSRGAIDRYRSGEIEVIESE